MDTKHLKRRRQTWYVRVRVPEQLRPILGKSEIVQSLQTRDLAEARRRRHAALDRILEYFATMQSGTDGGGWRQPADLIVAARQSRAAIEAGEVSPEIAERDWDAAVDAWAEDTFPDDPATFTPVLPDEYRPAVRLSYSILSGKAGALLSEALESHISEIGQRVRQQTANARERRVRAFLAWLRTDAEVRQVTREIAGKYTTHLLQQDGSTKTKKDTVSDLSAFFAWCLDRGYTDANPFQRMTRSIRDTSRGTKEKKEAKRRPWTRGELQTLLATIRDEVGRDDPLWVLTLIAMYTGMRVGEIAETQTEDVYDDRIHIPEGKTESSVRDVPLHPVIRPLVRQLVKGSSDGYLVSGLRRGGEDDKRHHAFSKRFGRFIRARVTKDPRLVFHSLRKSFATELENSGCPENIARQLLGHEKQSLSYGLYSGGVDLKALGDRLAAVTYGPEVTRLIKANT